MSMLPFDLTEILLEELRRGRRPNDGLLHASSHLTGSLRHAELEVVGAPKQESELLSEITLATGQMWHNLLHDTLRRQGVPYMAEVNLTPWMPLGWGGTLDGLFLSPSIDAFVIGDFKTIKGEGMRFILRDGAKSEHVWQLSMYWHAALKMLVGAGRLAKIVGVYYLPKNAIRGDVQPEPELVSFEPLGWDELNLVAKDRNEAVEAYKASLPKPNPRPLEPEEYVTPELAPRQERQQVIYKDRATGTWDVLLKPHWSAAYCPFPDVICDCNTEGQTKIGMYDVDGTYIPRTGYGNVKPTVTP